MEFNIAMMIVSTFIGYIGGNLVAGAQIKGLRAEMQSGFKKLEDAIQEQTEKHHALELTMKDYTHNTEFKEHKKKCDQTFKEMQGRKIS